MKNLRSIIQLNDIWQTRCLGDKDLSNKLRKIIPGIDEDGIPLIDNILTPRDGFELSSLRADLTTSGLNILINPLGFFSRELRRRQKKYAVKGILCFYDARRRLRYPYDFIIVDLDPQSLDISTPISEVRTFNTDEHKIIKRYRRCFLYLSVLIFDSEDKLKLYSNTLVCPVEVGK